LINNLIINQFIKIGEWIEAGRRENKKRIPIVRSQGGGGPSNEFGRFFRFITNDCLIM